MASGMKVEVKYYHRTLADIFSLLTDAGFAVTCFREPQPCVELVNDENRKYYEAGNRFPIYFVLEARRYVDASRMK